MVEGLRDYCNKVPQIVNVFLHEYCEVNEIAEKELGDKLEINYPTDSCMIQVREIATKHIVLSVDITSETKSANEEFRITYTMTIGGDVEDATRYPKTHEFFNSLRNGERTEGV